MLKVKRLFSAPWFDARRSSGPETMSAATSPLAHTPDAPPQVDDLLKAWFEALLSRPVPEALLRSLEAAEEGEGR
jgi:hypothetical protein